jgi:hypothetical protein
LPRESAGSSIAAKMAMMAMTTNSSTSVKPKHVRVRNAPPSPCWKLHLSQRASLPPPAAYRLIVRKKIKHRTRFVDDFHAHAPSLLGEAALAVKSGSCELLTGARLTVGIGVSGGCCIEIVQGGEGLSREMPRK